MSPLIGDAVFLSIHPRFAAGILSGAKRVELRRRAPAVGKGSLVVLYATSPVKAVLGAFRVAKIMVTSPAELWPNVEDSASVTRGEFDAYFNGAGQAVGLFIGEVFSVTKPVSLIEMKKHQPGFHPPQGYRYLRSMGRKAQAALSKSLDLSTTVSPAKLPEAPRGAE